MKIKVLYEDKDILAIDKPSGVLVDEILIKFPGCILVHRLDRETSGVMLLAKSKKAHEFLKKQFQARSVKKIYHAIVSGSVKNDRGVIDKPIGRSPKDFRRRLAGRGARGMMREAITEYKVLKRFETPTTYPQPLPKEGGKRGVKSKFTFLEIRPKTGRTHQIRVHMKYLNHPIVCDSLYNPTGPCPKEISRLALHAHSIEFKTLKGKIIKVESPLPTEFKKAIS